MKKTFTSLVVLFTLSTTGHQSQAQTELVPVLPDTPFNYANPPLPTHFSNADVRATDTTPSNNPVTDPGATLGRVLFYDKTLSANSSISCASCHSQSRGFSDQARLSVGFSGGLTARHSMGLSNARYFEPNRFFWDERANSLEDQTLQPIQDSVEMGETLENVITKLNATDYYQALFESAYGTAEINSSRMASSLAQFIRSMVSYRSKYDQGVASNFSNFTEQEEQGRQLFNNRRTACSACHSTDLQTMDQARNNGLDAITSDVGAGNGRFKSPSLRNVAVRAPFMHDGRFNTLTDVIDFYNSGIQDNPNLDNRLSRNDQPVRMGLDAQERAALVAFLNTLTDTAFLNDAAFSDPFQLIDVVTPVIVIEPLKQTVMAPILELILGDDTTD